MVFYVTADMVEWSRAAHLAAGKLSGLIESVGNIGKVTFNIVGGQEGFDF